jgi:TP901-1 family phage major tail protein
MAKVAGRKVKVYAGTGGSRVLVAGGRSDSINISNEPIDITDKGDDGWRVMLNDASVRTVEITTEGLVDGAGLIATSLGATNNLLGQYEIELEGIGTAAGQFFIASYEISAPHDGAAEFTGTFQSSGPITWTPA